MNKYLKIIIGVIVIIISGVIVWRSSISQVVTLKCPDSFSNSDEKIADLKKFSDSYYARHPNASEVDLADEMVKQWKANNCTEALKRYNDFLAGNISLETKENVESLVDEYINSIYYENAELGFSFQYPNHLFVSDDDPQQPNWVILLPKPKQANVQEPLTAIIISEANDNPEMTAEEWLNSPNSGYKVSRDGQYRHIKVGGQDAVITPDDWTVVKTPDGQRRVSIAYFVKQDKGAVPLKNELQTILNTFVFK